jgi:PAS domain S-box-containing protein
LATHEPPTPEPPGRRSNLRRIAESPLWRYGIALLSTLLALLLQRASGSFILPTPLLLFFGAVLLSGWWGGWGPGLLSIGMSALLVGYYFLPPLESFQLTRIQAVSLGLFALISVLITWLSVALRRTSAERALLLVRERAARAEAEAERARLHGLLMEAPAFVALLRGPEHVYVLSNPLNDEILGKGHLVGRPLREAVPEAEQQGFIALLDRVYTTGEPFVASEMPVRIPRPDGSVRGYFLNIIYQPTRDARGAIDGVASFGHDVTALVRARQRAEALAAELRLSEERYRTFLSKSTEGIYRVHVTQPIPTTLPVDEQIALVFRHALMAECNDAMARMYGFDSAAALTGARLDQLLVREDPRNTEFLRAFIQNAYRIDDAESHEIDRDGSRKVFLNNLVGVLEAGHIIGAWGTQRDVTKQRQAEEELRRAEANARFLAEASAVLASSLDYEATLRNVARFSVPALADWCLVDLAQPDGTLKRVEVTTAAAEDAELARQVQRFGLMPTGNPNHPPTQALLQGRSVLIEHFTPERIQASAHSEAHAQVIRAAEPLSFIAVPLTARGNTFGVLSFFTSRSGRRYTAANLSFMEELARRVALSVENARLYREAQEAIRLRDEFLSIASHELKTPLTPLSLKLHMLAREVQKQPDSPFRRTVEDYVSLGSRQVKKLSELVSDLLDVARITGGRLRLEFEDVALSALIREVVARHEPHAARLGSTFQLELQEGVVGRWDRLRAEQVITNLVDNALKYGAGKPVRVHLHADGRQAHLSVKDEGIGIAPEHLSRIFGRFERAVSDRHYGGLGLGLYITRTIVEAMGGSIHVESVPGQGALFTVVLPLKPGDPPPASALAS